MTATRASAVSRPVVRAPGAHLVDQGRDTPRGDPSRAAARVLRTAGYAALDWQQVPRAAGREWRRSGREPAAVPRRTWGTTAGPAGSAQAQRVRAVRVQPRVASPEPPAAGQPEP